MLTIFTSPKDFRGHFAVIQENAIASWCKVRPKCQIILLGKGYKVAQIAKKYHALHVPDIAINEFGTPLLPDVFKKAYEMAKFKKLAYVNCDIILTDDFTKAIKQIKLPRFFITGRRWNLNVRSKLEFKNGWQDKLKSRLLKEGRLDRYGANDYFVFTPKIDFEMPDFALGRTAWDNWLVYQARYLKIPVIDATDVIWAIHQKHDYSHAGGYQQVWHGPESQRNRELVGDRRKLFNVKNADYILTKNGITRPKVTFDRVVRKIEVAPVLVPKVTPFIYPLTFSIKLFKFVRDKTKLFR
ncbi:hypothetical protein A2870_03305 [Candidatus Curtissbacteria bacterium RIFCSPHIGHO2_01_FULL_41_11]|uniref:Glycosyltransferase 2-like domain-containing protein n=1 Tax=Candidatus Curtissbacteria bacterium RIFCSPHIGHO2_01_FULL_41_11 TaxID=1797711 RepID=A0A1F5G5J9_9BACT|nr:MAG: hypothetical protein A2870_03305 [Candidatus Curtissbacteria bacterium RIFCSPHIGHO2_01_FULL_41_11]